MVWPDVDQSPVKGWQEIPHGTIWTIQDPLGGLLDQNGLNWTSIAVLWHIFFFSSSGLGCVAAFRKRMTDSVS